MTRKTVSTITDTELTELYDQLAAAAPIQNMDQIVASFCIELPPVPKARARITMRAGKPRGYTPKRTVEAQQVVAWHFRRASIGHQPEPGTRFGVIATFHDVPTRGRDIDNLLKLVLDALNGVAWVDDRQVVHVQARKLHVAKGMARTDITVYRVAP